jgi:DNA-directed RNA polymerase specialized sigma24 family protein
MKSSKASFESKISEINQEINKRKHKWNLTSLAWMDFSDVSQILRIHIYKKWNLYDPKKPLAPWINRIVSNQIKNLIRNNYGNYSRPCLKCAAAEQEDGCSIYASQCSKCPLYAKWEKSKKSAHNIKLPVALENHTQEVHNIIEDEIDIEKTAKNIHAKMQQVLKPIEWKFYDLYYIQHKSEEESAKSMGYKTTEKNRKIGYKQVKNLKKSIMIKVKKYLYNGDIDIH